MRNIWKQSVLRMTQQNTIYHNVSTWSPLATAFNTRRRSLINLNLIKESTGLFGKPELANFDGFYALKENAINTTSDLINEALSGKATRPLVDIFDELSDTLCKVADLAEFVRIAHPKPLFANAAEDACITINGVVEKLNTNRNLYDALHNAVQNNTSGNKHLAELFLFDFEQSGIHLDGGPRKRVVHLTDLILQTGQRFMAGASSYRRIPRDQVPANVRSFFNSSGDHLLVSGLYADSADAMAREAAYRMYLAPDNLQDLTLTHLLDARREMAELCGFNSYADRAIKASTMETSPNVRQFLDVLSGHLHDRAKGDFDAMLQMKKNETPYLNTLACWDTPYFTQKAKTKWLQVASVDFSPYFSLGGCMEGLNLLVQSLYGIHFEFDEMRAGEAWATDVYKLAVVHESEGLLGHIYCDFYERADKPNQDCHFTIQAGKVLPDGSYQNPIVVVMLSLSNGHWNGPALLTPASVDNLFHEMGHALHSMMGRARYQHVSGTRCPTDLAEVPSVLMEYFASSPTVLRLFAKHFQTQEPMPEDMLQRLCAAKNVFSASEMQLQVFYSALDQRYHGPRSDPGVSTTDMLKEVQKQYYGLPYVENTAWQHRFSHLVGYGAKYYAYLISRSVAWTIWRDHFANDPLSRSAGEKLRNGILRHGGAIPPHSLLTEYLGTSITPTTLANSLAEELDCHKDSIDLIYKVSCNK